jgi:integrase
MARPSKVKYRADRDLYYCSIKRKQHTLAKGKANRAEATRAFGLLLAKEGSDPVARSKLAVATLCSLYIEHAKAHLAPLTAEWYERHLNSFVASQGHLAATAAKPLHVTAWLEDHRWSASTRHGAITAVKRAFRWGLKQGYLESNPLEHVERPPMGRREAILSDEQYGRILEATPDAEFRNLLIALRETGARPGEIIRVTAADLDLANGLIVLRVHKTRGKTGRPRLIGLTPRMVAMCRELAGEYKTGSLFRNLEGRPWTRNAIALRFGRLRKNLNLGPEATAYSLRHGFVTDALESGVPIATVAELVGHKSTAMISAHYSHLADRHAHLKDALARVRPDPSATSSASASAPPHAPPGDRDD